MENRVVLITGASSGIGKSIGDYLYSKGFIVYGTSRNPDKYTDSKFPLLKLDVSDVESIKNTVSEIVKKEKKLDVLINNAGKGITGSVEETPIEEMKKAFDTNFFGVVNVCKGVIPQMRKQNKGMILNISSIAGYMGLPYRGIYSATKSATSILSEVLSLETKQFGITVIDVAPGDFATNIAAGRYHTPLYDNSPYKKHYQKVLKQIDEEVDSGLQPKIMANAIYKIINKKNPRVRYRVGTFMQRYAIHIKRLLPDRLYEKILMKHYDLD
jgi:short-subunit dehydrogenase